MYNITVVFSKHNELGKCNSDELCKIIECIIPELIFEEIPPFRFDAYYKDQTIINLETKAIKKYSQNHKIIQCPVDDYDLSKIDKKDLASIKRLNTIYNNNIYYNRLAEEMNFLIYHKGFSFLNSKEYDKLLDKMHTIEEAIIKNMNDEYMVYVANSFDDLIKKRENKMISNIYKFSKGHKYDKAIFTIGSGHRKSIMQKIQEYERNEDLKLNWKFYNY